MQTQNSTVTVNEIQSATAKVVELQKAMTFLTPRTAEDMAERKRTGLGRKQLYLLENRVAEVRKNIELLPPRFDVDALERDTEVSLALAELVKVTKNLMEVARDTLSGVAGPALVIAASANTHFQVEKSTVERLSPLGKSRKNKSTSAAPPPAPTTSDGSTVVALPPGDAKQAA